VAPVVCLFGFLFIVYAILHKPAKEENGLVKKDENKEIE
jgi:hypothetical protein